KEVCTKQSALEFFNSRNVVGRTVFAVAEAHANMTDYRPVPSAYFARLRQRLGKVRLDDNNVGCFPVFNPLLHGGRWVEHQADLIMCLQPIKIDDLGQRWLEWAVAHDFDIGGLSCRSEHGE